MHTINLSGFKNLRNDNETVEVKPVEKAAVYVDNAANRKLGRVGQPYKKSETKKENKGEEGTPEIKNTKLNRVLANSKVLGKAEGARLDAIIDYAEFDISKDASDKVKRQEIAKRYIKSAELSGGTKQMANDLDEICEEALADYVPTKK